MVTVDVSSEEVAARVGRGHVVADKAVKGGGTEACHSGQDQLTHRRPQVVYCGGGCQREGEGERRCGRGHGTTAEAVATSDSAAWDGRAGCPSDGEAAGWLRCYRRERYRRMSLEAVAEELLQCCPVAQEPLRFCKCTRHTCRHLHIGLQTLGSTQLGPKHAKSLWTRTIRTCLPTFGSPLKGVALCHGRFLRSGSGLK